MKAIYLTTLPQEGRPSVMKLYKVIPPINYGYGSYTKVTEHIVVSAVNAFGQGNETYIFPADDQGNVLDWGELEGSQKGTLSHQKVLTDLGYTLVFPHEPTARISDPDYH